MSTSFLHFLIKNVEIGPQSPHQTYSTFSLNALLHICRPVPILGGDLYAELDPQ